MDRGAYLLVDIENPAIEADVKRPSRCEWLILVDDAIRGRDLFGGIAQQRIVHAERLRECLVRLWGIDADRKIRHVELPNRVAALTERLAFRCSPTGERLGKPSEYDDLLASIIGQPIALAVGTRQ